MPFTDAQIKNAREELATACRMIMSDTQTVALVAVVLDIKTGETEAFTMLPHLQTITTRVRLLARVAQNASKDINAILDAGI